MTALWHLFFWHPFVCSFLAPNEKFTESFVKNFTIRASCILFLKMMIAFFVITPLQDHNISMKFYVKSLHTGFLLQYLLIWLVYTVALLISAIEFSCPELLELLKIKYSKISYSSFSDKSSDICYLMWKIHWNNSSNDLAKITWLDPAWLDCEKRDSSGWWYNLI